MYHSEGHDYGMNIEVKQRSVQIEAVESDASGEYPGPGTDRIQIR